MADPVTILVWKNAQTNLSPDDEGQVFVVDTDAWTAYHADGVWYAPGSSAPLDPQPARYCDPLPPGEDALTTDGLLLAEGALDLQASNDEYHHLWPQIEAASARLRRAIENQEAQDGK